MRVGCSNRRGFLSVHLAASVPQCMSQVPYSNDLNFAKQPHTDTHSVGGAGGRR